MLFFIEKLYPEFTKLTLIDATCDPEVVDDFMQDPDFEDILVSF